MSDALLFLSGCFIGGLVVLVDGWLWLRKAGKK